MIRLRSWRLRNLWNGGLADGCLWELMASGFKLFRFVFFSQPMIGLILEGVGLREAHFTSRKSLLVIEVYTIKEVIL